MVHYIQQLFTNVEVASGEYLVIFLLSFTERQWSYELIFSGESSDYVLLPYITDLQDATACWWMKTEKTPGWSTVFSLHNYKNESLLSFSFHDNGSYSLHVHSEQK